MRGSRLMKVSGSRPLKVRGSRPGPYLNILDDQNPLVVGVVLGAEPLVRGEGLLPRRQDVHIAMPHPRHL